MEEVNQFLESTCASVAESNISITNFTFDPLCSLVCPPYNAKVYMAGIYGWSIKLKGEKMVRRKIFINKTLHTNSSANEYIFLPGNSLIVTWT
jgi:hypothetical protein